MNPKQQTSETNLKSPLERPPSTADTLWAVAYRSRPTQKMTEAVLETLLVDARIRNAALGISGLLVVGENDVVQWLEGPEPAVKGLMERIAADERHRDVTILESHPIEQRLFDSWAMLLASELSQTRLNIIDTLATPTRMLSDLKSSAAPASDILMVAARIAQAESESAASPAKLPVAAMSSRVRARTDVIDSFLAGRVLPEIATRMKGSNVAERPLLISAVTGMLLKDDKVMLEAVLRQIAMRARDPLAAQIEILEQTERRLGDLWNDDECSETDIVLALVEMTRVLRMIHGSAQPGQIEMGRSPSVLVMSQPGELHSLPAVLDAEVLYQRGWHVQLEFPRNNAALEQRISNQWFEAVDISLSEVFRRDHWLYRVADTVKSIREASLNRDIAVTVGGRVFQDDFSKLLKTGADRLVLSASEIERSVAEAIRSRRPAKRSS